MRWPEFIDLARFVLALVVVLGGGSLLVWGRGAVNSDAIIGILALVLGYYFGMASERAAVQRVLSRHFD